MSISKQVKMNNRVINQGAATLARATNPRHIEEAHAKMDAAEQRNEDLRSQEESGSGI